MSRVYWLIRIFQAEFVAMQQSRLRVLEATRAAAKARHPCTRVTDESYNAIRRGGLWSARLSDSNSKCKPVDWLHVLVKPKESCMNTRRTPSSRPVWALLLLSAALGSTAALAADNTTAAEKRARYQQERAECMIDKPDQNRTVCLQDATAAYAEAKRGGLSDAPSTPYADNAIKRCERLSGADRQDCVARMQGHGTTSGSVAAGGIYRETVTIEIGEPTEAPTEAPPDSNVQEAPAK